MNRLSEVLLQLALLLVCGISLLRFPGHLLDPSWPAHAKSHLTSQILLIAGSSLALFIMLWRKHKATQDWMKGALVLYAICMFGGYWAGKVLFELTHWRTGNTIFLFLTAVYVAGLILYCKEPKKRQEL